MEWPLTSGSYVVGDSNSPVAVVTLASENLTDDLENYAICGTCFTENFGIEKVIVNVLGNANISTLIVCGEESLHFCGQSIMALYENGIWDTGGFRKIVGSRAVLPYLNEIPLRAINRFIREIKVVDLVGTTDPTVIQESIDSCRDSSRSEASVVSMPEIDEDNWRKYESLVTQSMISHLKKRGGSGRIYLSHSDFVASIFKLSKSSSPVSCSLRFLVSDKILTLNPALFIFPR